MTRKDYIKIAECIRTEVTEDFYLDPVGRLATEQMLQRLTQSIGRVFALDNSRFDYARFEKACGLGEDK